MVSSDMLASFVKVAELASVSRAADRLDLNKSVVSKRIAQLEAELGTTLFSRSTRKIALTPAGEAYAEFAVRALAEMNAGGERVRALRSDLSGCIRLTSTVSWGQRVLTKVLPTFVRLHPGVEIELHLDDRVVDLAFERVDLALRWSASPVPELISAPVAAIGWSLAASPGYIETAPSLQHPHDLQNHQCLCYWRALSDDQWTLASQDAQITLRVHGRYRVDHPEAVVDAALAGLGVAMLPDYLSSAALQDGRLVKVLPSWVPKTRYGTQITAVGTPERMRLSRNQALLAFLRQELGGA
jgi:DNA-binding transcriptional LysR family regulator